MLRIVGLCLGWTWDSQPYMESMISKSAVATMRASINRWPQNRPQNTRILILGTHIWARNTRILIARTPMLGPLILGSSNMMYGIRRFVNDFRKSRPDPFQVLPPRAKKGDASKHATSGVVLFEPLYMDNRYRCRCSCRCLSEAGLCFRGPSKKKRLTGLVPWGAPTWKARGPEFTG